MVDEAAVGVPSVTHRIAFDSVESGAASGWLAYEALLAESSDAHVHEEMRPEELAVLHYTSGSTGKLKAAMQTVGNRFASLRKNTMGRMHAGEGDVLMLSGPITHASGMFIQPMLFQGATILLMEGFRPAEYWRRSRSTASPWSSWCRP